MAASVQDYLGYVPLMQPVQVKLAGIPKVLPDGWWNLKEDTVADNGRFVNYNGTRQLSRVQAYGSPPKQVQKLGVGIKNFKLLHSIEKIPYEQEMFVVLQAWDDYKPQHKFFLDQLVFQGEQFAQRQQNLRIAAVTALLAYGILWFDAAGNLLTSAGGADIAIDMGIPTGNRNQVGGIIDAPWSSPTANIMLHVLNLKTKALQATGRPLATAYYSKNIAQYMVNNASMQNYFARSSQYRDKIIETSQIPNGVMDLEWIPVQDAFFEDGNAAVQEFFPIDQITFTPKLDRSWYTLFEGGYPVPKSFGITGSALEMLKSVDFVHGMGRYAWLDTPPTSIHETQFDTFLPMIKVPECVFIVDVTP